MPNERSVSRGVSTVPACAGPHADRPTQAGDQRWARFRFSVVGPLLSAPPRRGELRDELKRLAARQWVHPITDKWVRVGLSTIERWYYRALRERSDPLGVLGRKIREDHGTHPSLSAPLRSELARQHRQHPDWSYRLHADNMAVRVEQDRRLGPMPSYESIRRYMQAHGMLKRRRLGGRRRTAGAEAAEARFEDREIRSYESEYINALWHLDFHHGSVRVLTAPGQWVYPLLLGILDDHSRLCCHIQWYLNETAEALVHGLSQAFCKRGLCRALMTDNGSAMTAAETEQGLLRLGVVHETTLPYSPYQNGKQESFWGQVEGRLLAMLGATKDLTLAQLNEATLAWSEMEYNRKEHSEIGAPPLRRFVTAKDVGRPSPAFEDLIQAFTAQSNRTQRRSDGTISVEAVRYEIPSHYRHLKQVSIRYAAWDLSHVYLVDARSGQVLRRLYPQDKRKNADGRRRRKESLGPSASLVAESSSEDTAPLLRKLIAEYAATGLPPAYLPKHEYEATDKESPHE
jgi:putative transposase